MRLTPDMLLPLALYPRAKFRGLMDLEIRKEFEDAGSTTPDLLSEEYIKWQMVSWCSIVTKSKEGVADEPDNSGPADMPQTAGEVVLEDSFLGCYATGLPSLNALKKQEATEKLSDEVLTEKIEAEVERYSRSDPVALGYDAYWSDPNVLAQYPYIANLKDLCKSMVLSTSQTEGLFSMARALLGDRRQSMKVSLLESLLKNRSTNCLI